MDEEEGRCVWLEVFLPILASVLLSPAPPQLSHRDTGSPIPHPEMALPGMAGLEH